MSRGYGQVGGERNRSRRRSREVECHAGPARPRLTVVKAVARNRLHPGAVVWAHIPFDEIGEEKSRPAVVVGTAGERVTVLPISSSATRLRYPDHYVEVDDLGTAGLTRSSAVRLRPVEIDRIELVCVCGQLGDEDQHQVDVALGGTGPRISEAAHAV